MNTDAFIAGDVVPAAVRAAEETVWVNPRLLPFDVVDGLSQLVVSDEDIADAAARLRRFAPFIRRAFPETAETDGLIESPLRAIPAMQARLSDAYRAEIQGRLLLKMDSHLAIAGSVKARGGIYEVLKHAEGLAMDAGLLSWEDDYAKIADLRDFFARYTVQVDGKSRYVHRHYECGDRVPCARPHVGRCEAVEEGSPARARRGGD